MYRFLQWLPKTPHPLSLRALNLACANVSGFALWNQPFYAKLYFKATARCSYLMVPYLLTTGTWQTHKVVQTVPSKNRSCWGAAVFRTTQAGETWPVIFLLRILQFFRAGCLAKLQTNWISPLLACIFPFDESFGPSRMHQQIPLPLISQDGEFNASEGDGEFNAENPWSVGEDVPCSHFQTENGWCFCCF